MRRRGWRGRYLLILLRTTITYPSPDALPPAMKPPRSKLRGIKREGIVCETPRFLTLFPLQGNLGASSEESPDRIQVMLYSRSSGIVVETPTEIMEAAECYGGERGVSRMWI